MLPDRVSNPGPLTYESDALPIALRGPAKLLVKSTIYVFHTLNVKSTIYVFHTLNVNGISEQKNFKKKNSTDWKDWLVGCFGFNSPLRQYFSLYRTVSQREGERKEKR